MKWEDYKKDYLNYELSVTQTRLISLISGEVLKRFPTGMPKKLVEPVFRKLSELLDTMLEGLEKVEPKNERKQIASLRRELKKINAYTRKATETISPPNLWQRVFFSLLWQ